MRVGHEVRKRMEAILSGAELRVGARVRIHALIHSKELNNQLVVLSRRQGGRWGVFFADPLLGVKALRIDNLRPETNSSILPI